MNNFWAYFLAVPAVMALAASAARAESITETYPDLEKFVYSEKSSKTYFGFGISPISIIGSKIGLSVDLFELHYIKDPWDLEIFTATFGTAFGSTNGSEQYFLFRTVPKYQILKNISIGPLLGLEFVSFANVSGELNKNLPTPTNPDNDEFTPSYKFSSMGAVYGGAISETFNFGKSMLIKVNEYVYKETYSYLGTSNGWSYYFDQSNLNSDPSPIAPSTVFMLNLSFLY
jgi:hypothetical protein